MSTDQWSAIHPDIVDSSQAIALAEKYDDAIFAAFRVVEDAVQQRIGSGSIGVALISEAFDASTGLPKIYLSSDPRNQQGARQLFEGALSYIRNDRGHKKAPIVPCNSMASCLLYLGFASFLLYLLTRDQNIYPSIDHIRVFGSGDQPRAEVYGRNFSSISKIKTQSGDLSPSSVSPTVLEVLLPPGFFGEVCVITGENQSDPQLCDTRVLSDKPDTFYLVKRTDIPLYSDANCTQKRGDAVGLLLDVNEGGREFLRILPVLPRSYKAGEYVTHGPWDMDTVVAESWFIDPDSSKKVYAWTWSALSKPNILGRAGPYTMTGLRVFPDYIDVEVDERRALTVVTLERDNVITKDVVMRNDQVRWSTTDPLIAYVDKGVVIPKKLGRTQATARVGNFSSIINIHVASHPKGSISTVFAGRLRTLQQIKFDSNDNLLICNQSRSVFRLNRDATFEEILALPGGEFNPSNIDCITLDRLNNLYLTDISERKCFMFKYVAGTYRAVGPVTTSADDAMKGIAVAPDNTVYVAVMGKPRQGRILRIRDLNEQSSFETRSTPIYLAVSPRNTLLTPNRDSSTIDEYGLDGTFLNHIPFEHQDSPCDIAVDPAGCIYVPFFHSGDVLRFDPHTNRWSTLATGLGTLGGLAVDSKGNVYVSDFAGSAIFKIVQ